jgi:hypothetical protein
MAEPRPYAVVAEFDRPDALVDAARAARERGFQRLEAFSPFPVEGLADALGFRERRIAPIMLAGGLAGLAGGFAMQAWVSLDFPLDVGGRPVLAWPAFTLIAVELMFLGAAVAGVLAMLVMNRLPRLHHPLFDIDEFHFASSDKFFLAVLADDAEFGAARDFLSGLGPVRLAEAPGAEAA